jgi:hypothetical protein
VGELPGTCAAEDDELNENPPDNACVCCFRLVTEFGLSFLSCTRQTVSKLNSRPGQSVAFEAQDTIGAGEHAQRGACHFVSTHPLEHLLPPHIVQPRVQVLDAARNVFNLGLVGALELA